MDSSENGKLISELETFFEELRQYWAYRILQANGKLQKSQSGEVENLRITLVRKSGKYKELITQLTDKEKIHVLGKGPEYDYDMWLVALRPKFNERTASALDICRDTTNRAIGKLEKEIEEGYRDKQGNVVGEPRRIDITGLERDSTQLLIYLFDKMQFHPRVVEASKDLFKDKYYSDAIFRAFTAVSNFVKEKSGLSLDGKALMSAAFNEEKPVIKINDLLTKLDRDEQEGFKFLFMGGQVGIRNPKAHDNVIQTDPYRTLEYLSLASLLVRRIEEGKVVKLQKNV